MLFPSILPNLFILFLSTLYAVIVEIWYSHISPTLAKSILPTSSIFTHCYFKFVHILKFPLHIEVEQAFFSTKLFFFLKNSSAYIQLWMHTSTVLWALQTFSSWNTGKWAVTSLLFSTNLREKRVPRCRMWKGYYFLQLLGSSLGVLITDWEMRQERQETGFVQIATQLYHRMDQTDYMRSLIYTEALVCLVLPDGDFSPSPTDRLMHSLHLEDILPTVTYN